MHKFACTNVTPKRRNGAHFITHAPYCAWVIKEIDSMLPYICPVIDHRGHQNVVRTSVTQLAIASCATFLFLRHFDLICDPLLDRCTATWNIFVKQTHGTEHDGIYFSVEVMCAMPFGIVFNARYFAVVFLSGEWLDDAFRRKKWQFWKNGRRFSNKVNKVKTNDVAILECLRVHMNVVPCSTKNTNSETENNSAV